MKNLKNDLNKGKISKKSEKKPENINLNKELGQKQQEIDSYLTTLKRLQAEFENYKKYIEKEKVNFTIIAKRDIILDLLNIVDDFERALKNIKDNEEHKGILMIYNNFKKLLQKQGVKEIGALNQPYDPYKHEVITFTQGQDNIIVEEIQKGYMLNDKIIRHSKVIIGKNNQNQGVENEKDINNQ